MNEDTPIPDGQKRPSMTALAEAIANGETPTAAAASLGMLPRSARRWAKTPRVRAMVAEIRSRSFDQGVGIMCKGISKAAQALVDLIDSDDPPSVVMARLGAARGLLSALADLKKTSEIDERLSQLEARFDGRQY